MTRAPSPLLERWTGLARRGGVAVEDDSGSLTFTQLDFEAGRVRAALLGARTSLSGERVGMLVEPGVLWVATFLGTVLAGGVAVPLSPLYPPREHEWMLDDAGAATVIGSEALLTRLGPPPQGRRVIGLAEVATRTAPSPGGERTPLTGDDPALLLYTSGTTGRPKGVRLSHRNLSVQSTLLADAWGFGPEDVLLHALPLHHLHGLGISLLTALFAGARVRLLPGFEATRVWRELASATAWMGVPTMYHRLMLAYDEADAPTRARWLAAAGALRLATSGSSALPVTLGERWRELTGQYPIERYGMTEIGVGMTNPFDGVRRPGTVGRPLPTVEVRLVGEHGEDVRPGEPGEIRVRGPSVFSGYHRRDAETQAAFADGWFCTGDLASCDADGYFRILGRTSIDILKSGGYKISALEIEEALREHEAIAEVAVVGVEDEDRGERVVAAVVARRGREAELTTGGVRAWAKERLAVYKVPREVVLFEALPRNAIGKVIKPELLRLLRDRVPGDPGG